MSLTTSCLRLLFTPPVPPPLPANPLDGDGDGNGNGNGNGKGTVKNERAAPPSSPASNTLGRRPSKRARKETTDLPDPGTLATSTGAPAATGTPFEQQPHLQQQQQQQEMVEAKTEAEVSTLPAAGAGVSATFFGRLAAVDALAELARAAAVVRGTLCDVGTVAATAPAAKSGSRRRRDTSSTSSGNGNKHGPLAAAGRQGGAGSGRTAAVATPRELVMSAVSERAGSGWAWERELAFLLMDACCAGIGDRESEEGGGTSGSTRGSGREVVRESMR